MAFEPLRPGEEPFNTGDKMLNQFQQSRGAHGYGRGSESAIKWDQPRFGATEEEEQKWAERKYLGDVRRQGHEEKTAYKAGRQGLPFESEDPALQEVHAFGEEMHQADRRHDFMIGLGAFGHAMGRLAHLGSTGSRGQSMLLQASRRHHR